MSKIFNSYLHFLGLLLLVGIANLRPHSGNEGHTILDNFETFEISNPVSLDTNINSVSLNPSKQDDGNKLLFDIVEIQDIENEESTTKESLISFDYYIKNLINGPLLGGSLCLLEKNPNYSKKYFDKSTTKLHIRLQVFII